MPADAIGSLSEEVLKWQNELARLRDLGLKDTAISVINATRNLAQAQAAEQAAVGSQLGQGRALSGRDIRNLFSSLKNYKGPSGGISSAGSLGGLSGVSGPNPANFLTPEFSAQYPEMASILNAPSPLDLFLNSIFQSPSQPTTPSFQPAGEAGTFAPRIDYTGQNATTGSTLSAPGTGTFRSPFPEPYGRTGPFIPLPEPTTTPGGRSLFPTTQNPTTQLAPESRFLPLGTRRPIGKQPKQTKGKGYKVV